MSAGLFVPVRFAALSAAALWFASGCSSDCGDAGCVPAVFADGSIETSSAQLIVTVCINQRCATAEADLAAGRCARLALSSDARICFTETAPGRLTAALEVHSIGGELAFADGDELTLEVTEKDTARVVVRVERPLAYESIYPNGSDCDDQPCRAATVSF